MPEPTGTAAPTDAEYAAALAVMARRTNASMEAMAMARRKIKAILEPLEPWQRKSVVEGLYHHGGYR